MTDFTCPHCGNDCTASEEPQSETVTCDHCGKQITTPTPPRRKLAFFIMLSGLLPCLFSFYFIALFITLILTAFSRIESPVIWDIFRSIMNTSLTIAFPFLPLGFIASTFVLILGILTRNALRYPKVDRASEKMFRDGMRFGSLNLICAVIAVYLCLPLAQEVDHQEWHERHDKYGFSCANKLKQFGIVFKMFANEAETGMYPQLSPEPGKLMFSNQNEENPRPIYPEYLTDLKILACPQDEDVDWDATNDPAIMIDDESYFYLGYAITNIRELQAFAEAYRKQIASGDTFKEDLPVSDGTGTAGSATLYRLRKDLQRSMSTDIDTPPNPALAQAILPVVIERSGNHSDPAGGYVAYLDGHVEFISHNDKWPMTDEALAILDSLDNLAPEQMP